MRWLSWGIGIGQWFRLRPLLAATSFPCTARWLRFTKASPTTTCTGSEASKLGEEEGEVDEAQEALGIHAHARVERKPCPLTAPSQSPMMPRTHDHSKVSIYSAQKPTSNGPKEGLPCEGSDFLSTPSFEAKNNRESGPRLEGRVGAGGEVELDLDVALFALRPPDPRVRHHLPPVPDLVTGRGAVQHTVPHHRLHL